MVLMLSIVETDDCVFIGIVLNIKWKKREGTKFLYRLFGRYIVF
jgi:hypothetical protein